MNSKRSHCGPLWHPFDLPIWTLPILMVISGLFVEFTRSPTLLAQEESTGEQVRQLKEAEQQEQQEQEQEQARPRQRRGQREGGQRGQQENRGSRPSDAAASESLTTTTNPESGISKPLPLPQEWADQVSWRSIGPANMSGRIVALAVYPHDTTRWWAATGSGGLLKTNNNGVTFEHQFDKESTVSIGDVQVASSNPDIVWVGTGEHNPRNSTSWGDGVYKSIDGGKTWNNMGLKESFQIGRIAIHPENSDIVWVGSLGRLWGPSSERGLYKTSDGGETWRQVLFINDDTGVIDVKLNPSNPDEMLVATYERRRGGFDVNDPIVRFGEGSGVYKSKDGGESFTKITEGLPTVKMGRIAFDYFQADPNYVVAVVESEKVGQPPENLAYLGVQGEDADVGTRITAVTEGSPAEHAGLQANDILLLINDELAGGYQDLQSQIRRWEVGDKLQVMVAREGKKVELEIELANAPRQNRGAAVANPFRGELGGQAANVQDQQGAKGFEHGGIYLSENGGESWQRINSLNPRPMYFSHVRFDPQDRNNIYVLGVALYRSFDGGKTFRGDGGSQGIHVDHHTLWVNPSNPKHMILGNDGGIYITYDQMAHWDHFNKVAIGQFYHVGVDSRLDYNVYGGLQDNGSWGGPMRGKHGQGALNSDWFRVGGGDGFLTIVDPEDHDLIYFESQNGAMQRVNLRTGERASLRPQARGQQFRFNWKTPFMLSPHNSRTHYSAGNFVFKSTQRGSNASAISPEITNTNQGSGSAITESPVEEGVIYAGTTDGAIWMTRNGGTEWQPLFYTGSLTSTATDETGDQADPETEQAADQTRRPRQGQRGSNPAADSRTAGQRESGEQSEAVDPQTNKSMEEKQTAANPFAGRWQGMIDSSVVSEEPIAFFIELTQADEKKMTGTVESPLGSVPLEITEFDVNSGKLTGFVDTDQIAFSLDGKVDGAKMTGVISITGAGIDLNFEAKKQDAPFEHPTHFSMEQTVLTAFALIGYLEDHQAAPTGDDPISGHWQGNMSFGQGELPISLILKLDAENQVSGSFESRRGMQELQGSFDPVKGNLTLTIEREQFSIELSGEVKEGVFTGKTEMGGGRMTAEFQLKRQASDSAADKEKSESETTESEEAKEESAEPRPTDQAPQGRGQRTGRRQQTTDAAAQSTAEEAETATPAIRILPAPTGDGTLASLMPGPRWVSALEASRFAAGRCYISLDGHRSDDVGIYIFVTDDYGQNWTSLKSNLPDMAGPVRVIREDLINENLLYLGCEFSAWYSIDRGQNWTRFNREFPTVAVHEFAIHPNVPDVVAGTHGRSMWIADVSLLRQFTMESMQATAKLYEPRDVILWRNLPARGDHGPNQFVAQNPPRNASLAYSLNTEPETISFVIKDLQGNVVKTLEAPKEKGLHVIGWGLDRDRDGGQGQASTGGGRGRARFGRQAVPPGEYLLVLTVDGEEQNQVIKIRRDPSIEEASNAEEGVEFDEEVDSFDDVDQEFAVFSNDDLGIYDLTGYEFNSK